jgi:hypothetical protein
MDQNNQVIIQQNDLQLDQQLLDLESPFGPIELSLLERIESGLSDHSSDKEEDPKESKKLSKGEKPKFAGPREVIFVSGWVNVNAVYARYLWGFVSKIILGILIIYSLEKNTQNLWPVAAGFIAINMIHALKSIFFLIRHRNGQPNIKIGLWIDLHISLGYLFYFTGFLLTFIEVTSNRFLPLFSIPYIAISVVLFFSNNEENFILCQKKFQIFEALQLLIIAIKFSNNTFVTWNYALIFFMSAAIYLTVLGALMSVILSCSMVGFLYNNLESWKTKSLVWMTWYYLTSGLIYIYFIKGIIQFYNEENVYTVSNEVDYFKYTSNNSAILRNISFFLICLSFVNLILHLIWKTEIKRYLTKVIYRNEIRKEINMRYFDDSFAIRLSQISATYFTKLDLTAEEPAEGKAVQKDKINEEGQVEAGVLESELCIFCCDEEPNIMIDPCGHGGVCKKCVVQYLKQDDEVCPFCKGNIEKLYLIEINKKTKEYCATAEINFKGKK